MAHVRFPHSFEVDIQFVLNQVGIQNYDKTKLNRTDTEEKNQLPTAEDIQREKEEAKNQKR